MNHPIYVVISGKKRHGKNFFTDKVKKLLIEERISFTETAFATPIKEFCHNVLGIPMEDMETQEGKMKSTHICWCDVGIEIANKFGKVGSDLGNPVTIRELLQIIGTDLFRNQLYGPIWAEAPFRKQHTIPSSSAGWEQKIVPDVVFITDCRFPNEVIEAFKHNALLVRVIRDDIENDGDEHISEIALDDYEWASDEKVTASTNDGRLDEFAKNVLLPRIKGRLYGH